MRAPGEPTPQESARQEKADIDQETYSVGSLLVGLGAAIERLRIWSDRNEHLIDFILTLVIAGATVFLAISTTRLWAATSNVANAANKQRKFARNQNRLTRAVERAYVKMSHEPPGIEFRGHTVWGLQIKVSNHGRTPAEITDAHVVRLYLPHNQDLPERPDYLRRRLGSEMPSRAFLVTDDHFWFPYSDAIPRQRKEDILNGKTNLYVIGYVDYTDQFGTKHRAGYARQYAPDLDVRRGNVTEEQFAKRSNLGLVTNPGYNYDRVRGPDDITLQQMQEEQRKNSAPPNPAE